MFIAAWITKTFMAVLVACVFWTIQQFVAFLATDECLFFIWTTYFHMWFPTAACNLDSLSVAWLASSSVTQFRTRVLTIKASLFLTIWTTTMGLNTMLWLWVAEFATKTEILRNRLAILEHALRTCPVKFQFLLVLLFVWNIDPSFDAFQVHKLVATRACPNCLKWLNVFRTDQTQLFRLLFFLDVWSLFWLHSWWWSLYFMFLFLLVIFSLDWCFLFYVPWLSFLHNKRLSSRSNVNDFAFKNLSLN